VGTHDTDLVARPHIGVHSPDELRKGVFALSDERIAFCTHRNPRDRRRETVQQALSARDAERESTIGTVGDEALAVRKHLLRPTGLRASYREIAGGKEGFACARAELIVGDGSKAFGLVVHRMGSIRFGQKSSHPMTGFRSCLYRPQPSAIMDERRKVLVGSVLLVAGSIVVLAYSFRALSVIPGVVALIAALAMATGTLLIGTSAGGV